MKALKRLIIKLMYKLIRIRDMATRPKSVGIRTMVFNKKGQVLLVKHSYRPEYFFPGGGVEKGEGFIEAGSRELWEETGLQVNKWDLFGVYKYNSEYKDNTVVLLVSDSIVDEEALKIDNEEIIEAGWYGIDDLPIGIHPPYVLRLQEYKDKSNPITGAW